MKTKEYKTNNDADWKEMCDGIGYEILVRTVVRLAPNLVGEIMESAQELIDAQPDAHRQSVMEPVALRLKGWSTKLRAKWSKIRK